MICRMEAMLQGIKNIMMFSVAHKRATNDMFHNIRYDTSANRTTVATQIFLTLFKHWSNIGMLVFLWNMTTSQRFTKEAG